MVGYLSYGAQKGGREIEIRAHFTNRGGIYQTERTNKLNLVVEYQEQLIEKKLWNFKMDMLKYSFKILVFIVCLVIMALITIHNDAWRLFNFNFYCLGLMKPLPMYVCSRIGPSGMQCITTKWQWMKQGKEEVSEALRLFSFCKNKRKQAFTQVYT